MGDHEMGMGCSWDLCCCGSDELSWAGKEEANNGAFFPFLLLTVGETGMH